METLAVFGKDGPAMVLHLGNHPLQVPQHQGQGEGVNGASSQALAVYSDVDPKVETLPKDCLPLQPQELDAGVG